MKKKAENYSCKETCWNAIKIRAPKADGKFFYSVVSTGVYCRPICPARLPRKENVLFHATLAEAKSTGFRPCKRCKPDLPLQQECSDNTNSMKYKKESDKKTILYSVKKCSLGNVLVAATSLGICTILLEDTTDFLIQNLRQRFLNEELKEDDLALANWVNYTIEFIEKPTQEFNLPLDIRGTVFQQKVWHTLKKIPVGKTASYTEIARQIDSPKAVRAVAQACASNVLAVVIPCHRVVRLDGALSGYRWGVERKQILLEREALQI